MFLLIGWDYVSELQPPVGLLFLLRWYSEYGQPQWNDIDRENGRTQEKTCPSATLFTTNPTWADPGTNPGLHSERPRTNCLSHGMAL
jgi:hypothetical protein